MAYLILVSRKEVAATPYPLYCLCLRKNTKHLVLGRIRNFHRKTPYKIGYVDDAHSLRCHGEVAHNEDSGAL